ncbi:hypothetical protein BGX20_005214 [Mortierella sp. AD010]|nr:hypothetical protein BGX20_005214 [Mortierella sp. AD010]
MSRQEPITEDYVSPHARVVFGPQWRKDKNGAQLIKSLGQIPKLIETGPLSGFKLISKPIDSHGLKIIDIVNLHELPRTPSNSALLRANALFGNKEDTSLVKIPNVGLLTHGAVAALFHVDDTREMAISIDRMKKWLQSEVAPYSRNFVTWLDYIVTEEENIFEKDFFSVFGTKLTVRSALRFAGEEWIDDHCMEAAIPAAKKYSSRLELAVRWLENRLEMAGG